MTPTVETPQLDDLLRRRTGGQINIRGLRFQLLYALRRAAEMLRSDCAFTAIGLERFEDIDLYGEGVKPFRIQSDGMEGGNTYLQVKTCDGRWVWSNLKQPIKSLLEVLRADENGQFYLVLNFSLDGEPLELSQIATLPAKRQRSITKKFQQLCQSVGGTVSEADTLLPRLHIITTREEDILRELRLLLAEGFDLHGAGVDRYLSILFERLLLWSRERKVVSRDDLARLRDGIAQDLALETAYEAFGRGLLVRADWEADARPDDFFEGKETRTGHVAAELDVRRPHWHERIRSALGAVGTVVVRAPSGQGKSTLALRFARDEWPQEDTFVLKTAQTPAEVEMVCSVLRHRTRTLGLSTYLLLDNAGRQTAEWPRVAQECLALGVPVLATLRQEDWYRFARTHRFSYEPIEPSLEADEAKRIYDVLRERGRIHPSVESAEWAYEKIREPHLLMEYVYLLTHGQMLEDRLRDQVADIVAHENMGKLEILRRVALADALSAPVLTDRLCEDVAQQPGFAGDARQLVCSLEDEYLKRRGDRLGGLHWVRSDHLVRLLHDDPSHLADTALAVLDAVPFENLSDAVSNALCRTDLDRERLMNGILDRGRDAASVGRVPILLALLEGVFEAGERDFLEANRTQFDEAHAFLGQAGPFLLKMECSPASSKKFLRDLRDVSGTLGEGLDTLLAIGERLIQSSRGRDLAAQLLSAATLQLPPNALFANIGETGDLLAWHGWCGVPCPAYDANRDHLLERVKRLDYEFDELQRFTEGLWLHDRNGYRSWLDSDPHQLNGYLRWELDLLKLAREDVNDALETKDGAQGQMSIEFFATDYEKAGEETIARMQSLYSLFPFYARYNAQGVWPYPPEAVTLWHDPTTKHMTQESQYLRFHIRRNQTWSHVVESHYELDNYYTYQREWDQLRRNCLEFVLMLSRRLRAIVTGQMAKFDGAFPGDVIERTQHSLATVPHPPAQTPDELKTSLKPASEWAQHWSAFRMMLLQSALYFTQQGRLASKDEDATEEEREAEHRQHLSWHNFQDVCKDLPAMQSAMRALFDVTSDYFGAASLDSDERRAYAEAVELLDIWLKHPLPPGTRNIEAHVSARRDSERRELLSRLHHALEPLELTGVTFLYPENIMADFPSKMLPLGFSVDDPCRIEQVRNAVLDALYAKGFENDVDFFWLVPMHRDVRPLEGGFRASSRLPQDDDEQGWLLLSWTLNEQPIPDKVWDVLPELPVQVSRRLRLTATARNLVLQMECLLRVRTIVEELCASGDPYDAKIYEKHKNRLLHEQSNLAVDYEEMRVLLKKEFGARQDDLCYKAVELLLDVSQQLSQASEWEKAPTREEFSSQMLRDAIDELIAGSDEFEGESEAVRGAS